jgi:hypothetical protein
VEETYYDSLDTLGVIDLDEYDTSTMKERKIPSVKD